jgi:hypothetical protein
MTEYPLGQIEVKGGAFEVLNTKIVVGPHVIQVYKKDDIYDTDKIDDILRAIVVCAKGETASLGKENRTEVQTISLLKLKSKLINEIMNKQEE